MFEIQFITIGSILALLGLCEVLHGLRMFFLAPCQLPISFSVVRFAGEDAARQLYYAANALSWSDPLGCRVKIAVCELADEEQCKECKKIAAQYDMVFCTPEMLSHILETLRAE